jgi:hypothetical protein
MDTDHREIGTLNHSFLSFFNLLTAVLKRNLIGLGRHDHIVAM